VLIALMVLGMVLPALGVALMLRSGRGATLDATDAGAGLTTDMLVPREPPLVPGWRVSPRRRGGADSGEVHDAVVLPDGRLMVALFGVTSRGPSATGSLALVRAGLRSAAARGAGPACALQEAGRLLCPELQEGEEASCVLAILEPDTGCLRLAGGGTAAVLYRSARGVRAESDLGPAFGSSLDAAYHESDIQSESGDALVLLGRGVLTARNDLGHLFGLDRAADALGPAPSSAEASAEAILEAMHGFGARGHEEEATVLVLERLPRSTS